MRGRAGGGDHLVSAPLEVPPSPCPAGAQVFNRPATPSPPRLPAAALSATGTASQLEEGTGANPRRRHASCALLEEVAAGPRVPGRALLPPLPPAREPQNSAPLPPSPPGFQGARTPPPIPSPRPALGKGWMGVEDEPGLCGALHGLRGSETDGAEALHARTPWGVSGRGESPHFPITFGADQSSHFVFPGCGDARKVRRLPDGGGAIGGEAPGQTPKEGERGGPLLRVLSDRQPFPPPRPPGASRLPWRRRAPLLLPPPRAGLRLRLRAGGGGGGGGGAPPALPAQPCLPRLRPRLASLAPSNAGGWGWRSRPAVAPEPEEGLILAPRALETRPHVPDAPTVAGAGPGVGLLEEDLLPPHPLHLPQIGWTCLQEKTLSLPYPLPTVNS